MVVNLKFCIGTDLYAELRSQESLPSTHSPHNRLILRKLSLFSPSS